MSLALVPTPGMAAFLAAPLPRANQESARRDALDIAARLGLPSPRDEDWRLTDLRPLSVHAYEPLDLGGKPPASAPDQVAALRIEGALTLVFWNGRHVADLGDALETPVGVTLSVGPDVPLLASSSDGLQALNGAFGQDGVSLTIAAGVAFDRPVHIIHLGDAVGHSVHTRTIVSLGEGASASLVESFAGSADSLTNHRLAIDIAPGAALRHAVSQEDAGEALHFQRQSVTVAEGGSYEGFVLALGARLSRHEARIDLTGVQAHGAISGAYLLRDRQQAVLATTLGHLAPDGTSRQLFKGMVDDRAHGVFQGKVLVAQAGQRTDAHQLSKSLLLSDRARVDAKPELEIYADDVKCSHGATVGDLDQAALFYLQARGIDPATARAMLIEAFASDAVEQVADPAIRALLMARITAWLEKGRAS